VFNEHVASEALQALLEREIGPEAKDTIVTAGQQLIKQGSERGIARSPIDVYEARFGAIPEEIRAVIEATHDEPILVTWLKLAGTRGADEVTAAIRAFRRVDAALAHGLEGSVRRAGRRGSGCRRDR